MDLRQPFPIVVNCPTCYGTRLSTFVALETERNLQLNVDLFSRVFNVL